MNDPNQRRIATELRGRVRIMRSDRPEKRAAQFTGK